jgi:beta-carotene 3-hydroxylase
VPYRQLPCGAVQNVLIVALAFVLMEPFTYCAHRWVMHGLAKFLHESHHRNAARAVPALLEANDFFPVILAAGVNILLALGFNQPSLGALVPTCVGITAYGFAYFIVHDVYIHRRLRLFGNKKVALLERLAVAHRRHHQFNGEPYGMLLPITGQRASGSIPSQVPAES